MVEARGNNNPETLAVCRRIDKEWISPAFIFLKMFGDEIEYQKVVQDLRVRFKDVANKLDSYEVCEHAGRYEHWQKYQDFVDSL